MARILRKAQAPMSSAASRTARRLVIFGLFGPPLGLLTGLGVFWLIGSGGTSPHLGLFVLLQPAAYLLAYFLGLLPALAVALTDSVLVARGTQRRMLWTMLAGGLCSIPSVAAAVGVAGFAQPLSAAWILVGAVPAVLCSWLADRFAR
jgi:hypothetical protein